MSATITPKELSITLGLKADGKALRRFMRKLADDATNNGEAARVARVGQGNRYAMTASDAKAIASAWNKVHGIAPKSKAKRAPRSVVEAAAVAESVQEGA